ncbi:hypothetical protein BDZ97DRAFT_2054199 [Flammula alnicola]|nr:hypothetical protein BDZ97DRAFT_2054199 [Flammula alnicola]
MASTDRSLLGCVCSPFEVNCICSCALRVTGKEKGNPMQVQALVTRRQRVRPVSYNNSFLTPPRLELEPQEQFALAPASMVDFTSCYSWAGVPPPRSRLLYVSPTSRGGRRFFVVCAGKLRPDREKLTDGLHMSRWVRLFFERCAKWAMSRWAAPAQGRLGLNVQCVTSPSHPQPITSRSHSPSFAVFFVFFEVLSDSI